MVMITRESQKQRLLNRLEATKDDETICLCFDEVRTLLEMIGKGGKQDAEIPAGHGKGENESNGD